jgi:hypothetical protein
VLTLLFDASSAVTVELNEVPAIAVAGAVTEKCVADIRGGLDEPLPPPPQALRRHNPQKENDMKRGLFMTPPKQWDGPLLTPNGIECQTGDVSHQSRNEEESS